MDKHTADRRVEFENKVQTFPEVVSCSIVTGRSEDYLLKVRVRDMHIMRNFCTGSIALRAYRKCIPVLN